MHLTQAELHHYHRHFNLPEVGKEGQFKLKNSRVLYVGAGGLGSSALLYLAAAGVGTLGIIDDDQIEASNLHRQVLYCYDDLGKNKVDAAKSKLQKLNPAIQINTYHARLNHNNALDIMRDYDFIADGSDNFTTRYIVNDACLKLKKIHVHASISQFKGQCTVLTSNDGPCYRCLFSVPPPLGLMANCAEAGVLGVLPGIMGTIQATEVIKLILGIGNPLVNRLLMFNALEMKFRELAISKDSQCQFCSMKQLGETMSSPENNDIHEMSVNELQALRQSGSDFLLLDVREPTEYGVCNLGGKLIPLKSLPDRLNELNKDQAIVVHCKSGGRSRQAAAFLKTQGFSKVSNLTGGIMAWIEKIDPSMTRY